MNDWTLKRLFWVGMGILLVAVLVLFFFSPMLAVGILLAALLAVVLVMFFMPDLWQRVRPARKQKKQNGEARPRQKGETVMMLESTDGRGDRIMIYGPTFNVGRAKENDHIFTYPTVSRRHCRILYDQSTKLYYLENLDGKTFVNDEKLERNQRKLLRPGNMVKFDRYGYVFKKAE